MKTVTISSDFTGYPAGKRRIFVAGEEAEVSNEYAELLVTKGLAKETAARTTSKPAPADAALQKDEIK